MTEYKKGNQWNRAKTQLMLDFEKQTGKNAIRAGKITGWFDLWIWKKKKINPKLLIEEKDNEFYRSLKINYNKLKYSNDYVAIDALYRNVHDDTFLVRDQFARKFWKFEGKRFRIISKKIGLPMHGYGIDPEPNIRLYKLEFYR